MYYDDYDDYMRSVLGYSNTNDNTYCNGCYYGMNYSSMDYNNRNNDIANLEQMYPEIYRIINPMVCKLCDNNTKPVNDYLIEQMTDDIYDNVVNRVEVQNVINLNIGTREADDIVVEESRGESKENRENRSTNLSRNTNTSSSSIKSTNTGVSANSNVLQSTQNRSIESESRDVRSPHPRRRNTLLRDLIRILLINRLIRPGRPNRPPFRPMPCPRPIGPRPPIPGPMGPRPPMPRYDDYEW